MFVFLVVINNLIPVRGSGGDLNLVANEGMIPFPYVVGY